MMRKGSVVYHKQKTIYGIDTSIMDELIGKYNGIRVKEWGCEFTVPIFY